MRDEQISEKHDDDADGAVRVELEVDLEASMEAAWAAISDPTNLAAWLGTSVELDVRPAGTGRVVDDDGTAREVLVTDVREGQRIAWHWWSDDGDVSSVELTLGEHGGLARLRIVEIAVPADAGVGASDTQTEACSRRWATATSRLWQHVGAVAFR